MVVFYIISRNVVYNIFETEVGLVLQAGEVPASTTVTLKLEDMEMIDDHKDSWDFEYSGSGNTYLLENSLI